MQTIAIIGTAAVIGLSMITDASGTVKLVTTIVTTRGITWIVKKIIDSMDKDKADLINFAGWSIAGVAMVKILKNATASIDPVMNVVGKVGDAVNGLGNIIGKILEVADKITFWH